MKILVIGGTRFIGAHVVRCLHDAGHEVVAFHRGRSTNPILPHVEHVLAADAAYPIIAFPDRLRRDWDVVVHMVAMGRADAEAAVETFEGRAGRLVVVSSCDVYQAYGRLTRTEPGPPAALPLSEEAALRSVLYPYRGMEAQLGAYAHDYDKTLVEAALRGSRDLDWTILRLSKVYGPEDNGDLSTIYDFAAVPGWCWTHAHVTNAAAAIATSATHANARNRIFNIGEEHTPTMGERLSRMPTRDGAAPEPPPFDYGQSLVADTSRIRSVLGYADVLDEVSAMTALAERTRAGRSGAERENAPSSNGSWSRSAEGGGRRSRPSPAGP